MDRFRFASKVITLIGCAAGAWYLWYAEHLSGEALFFAAVSLIVLRGFGVLSEKVDGLHWRLARLAELIDPSRRGD